MKRKTTVRTAVILFLAMILFLLSGCGTPGVFDGSMTTNETGFHLDYTILNKEVTADLTLAENEQLRVEYTHQSGNIDISVGRQGKAPVYTGTGQTDGEFTLVIPEAGVYRISVTGHQAKGRAEFIRIK